MLTLPKKSWCCPKPGLQSNKIFIRSPACCNSNGHFKPSCNIGWWLCGTDCPQGTLWEACAIASLSFPKPSINTPVAFGMHHEMKQKGRWIRSWEKWAFKLDLACTWLWPWSNKWYNFFGSKFLQSWISGTVMGIFCCTRGSWGKHGRHRFWPCYLILDKGMGAPRKEEAWCVIGGVRLMKLQALGCWSMLGAVSPELQ